MSKDYFRTLIWETMTVTNKMEISDIKDAQKIEEISKKLLDAYGNIKVAKSILKELKSNNKDLDVKAIEQYISIWDLRVEDSFTRQTDFENNGVMINAIRDLCKHDQQLVYYPESKDYEEIKYISRDIMSGLGNSMVFVITPEFKVEGKVTISLFPNEMKTIQLVQLYDGEDGIEHRFFGDRPIKGKQPLKSFESSFYVYRFESNNTKYTLLSKIKLKTDFCKIKGMRVKFLDDNRIGETLKIKTNINFLFVYDVEPAIELLTPDRFKEITKDWTKEKLTWWIFGKHRHPEWFEKLIFAWLFSGDIDDYPLHLGIEGPAGTGKTKGILMPIANQLPDYETDDPRSQIFWGDNSTLKSLVPNFGGPEFNEGYFAQRRRIAYIDEFLSSVRRAYSGKNISECDETALLKNLLEHNAAEVRSGKTRPAIISATAKAIFCMNPDYGISNIVEIASKINKPFMSRILWYEQTKLHCAFINKNKTAVSLMEKNKKYSPRNKDITSVYDYLTNYSLQAKLDTDRVNKVYDKYLKIVPEQMREVYKGRYSHHYCCLVDGVAKYNSILEKRETIEILPTDYDQAEDIFAILIASWSESIDFSLIPIRTREQYLKEAEQRLYEYICKGLKVTLEELNQAFDMNCLYVLERLIGYELIKKVDNLYYPHWYTMVTTGSDK